MMDNVLASIIGPAQGRAPNTIALRQAYNEYVTQAQINGQQPVPFEEWAKVNYPDMKILSQ